MKNTTLLCAVAIAALFAGPAEAIYKCTTPKGVVYQDRPCKDGAESDVTIVNNTVELGAKGAAQDDSPQSNVWPDNKPGAAKAARTNDDPTSVGKPGDNRATNATTSDNADTSTKRNGIRTVESVLPMSADEARRTEPTAKYYTTDAAAPGAETPEQMTCESPNGEKRRFILSNGKLTSI